MPSIPKGSARGGAAVGVYNDLLVRAGGLRAFDTGKGLGDTFASVIAYNLTQNKWVSLPTKAQNLPDAGAHAGAAFVDGVFYVIGGSKNNVDNVQNTVTPMPAFGRRWYPISWTSVCIARLYCA